MSAAALQLTAADLPQGLIWSFAYRPAQSFQPGCQLNVCAPIYALKRSQPDYSSSNSSQCQSWRDLSNEPLTYLTLEAYLQEKGDH